MSLNNLPRAVVSTGMRESNPEKFSGFTLIELITVVAIVGVLSAIAIPLYAEYIEKARIVRAISEIITISRSITAYSLDNSKYPQSLDEVGWGVFKDPWGAPYQYLNIQTMGKKGKPRTDRFIHPINSDYDLYSMGKDGQSQAPLTAHASKDDVIRANDGAYIGLASGF
jgi:general secretion pathway protein G